jgi:hypothetical protein
MKHWLVLVFLICSISLWSQCDSPPNGESCLCSTAPILCDPIELDGFMFTMSTTTNTGGVPTMPADLCPGSNPVGMANSGSPNNVNWFAFKAWCTNLTINVAVSNCSQGTPGNFDYGVQIALFANCGAPWNPIQCITTPGAACGSNSTNYPTSQVFVANGLTVGNTYYFLLDGCAGSACTVTLDVMPDNCFAQIAPWANPMTGPTLFCQNTTQNFSTTTVAGATDYHWYIDGMLISQGPNMTNFSHSFPMAGTYTVCVDSSNDPCIPESESPPPLCKTVTVLGPVEGEVVISPQPICPNETVTITRSGYEPLNIKHLVITNAAGVILQTTTNPSTTFTSTTCATYKAYVYSYYPGSQTAPVVGNNVSTLTCATDCCILDEYTFSFTDNIPPVFENPPGDLTLACYDLLTPIQPLGFTDNCDSPGNVNGTQTGSFTNCLGGVLTRTWTKTDTCGNTATHVQTITINSIPIATIQAPDDITVSCINTPAVTYLPPLDYTNSAAGGCLIQGTIIPVRTPAIVNCAGTITYTWTQTDICNRIISDQQVYTILPPDEAVFLSPPGNITVPCTDKPPVGALPPLNFTNNDIAPCLISGTVIPTRVDNFGADCSGTVTYTWTYTDMCNRILTHQQIITVVPPFEADFISPPADMTIECPQIPAPGVLPPLNYTNGSSGACLIQGTIIPTRVDNIVNCQGTITYTWTYEDMCDRLLNHQQVLTVNPPPLAVLSEMPANMTIPCVDIPAPGVRPPINFTNNSTGNCLIQGTIIPTRVDNIVNCEGTITYTWTYTDYCNRLLQHIQVLTVLPPPIPVLSSLPANATIPCTEIPAPGVRPPLTFTNNSSGNCLIQGTIIPTRVDNIVNCEGTITYTWTYTDYCNRLLQHIQVLTVLPPPLAVLSDMPASATIPCTEIPAPGIRPPLTYTNNSSGNCLIQGTLIPTRVDNITNCEGTITYTWMFTDYCNRVLQHIQVLTVTPPPVAVLNNPPQSATINCTQVPPPGFLPPLTYTNSSSGNCLIQGTLTPTRTDGIANCQGTITFTWMTTDYCNRPIQHVQVLTLLPPAQAQFVDPPASQNINCDQIPPATFLPPLNYSNSDSDCLISGSIIPTRVDAISNCQGTITFTWAYTDMCGRITNHVQVLTLTPPTEAFPVNPPLSTTISCDQVPPVGFIPALTYTNNQPGGCLVSGPMTGTRIDNIVDCQGTIVYEWTAVDRCGRTIFHTQTLTVTPPPPAVLIDPIVYNTPITCAQALTFTPPNIQYSNSHTCLVSGSLTPQVTNNFTPCGGTINILWTGQDRCNRTIEYSQIIIVQPAPPSALIAPPADISVPCTDLTVYAISIPYNNGLTGDCRLEGELLGVLSAPYLKCGGVATVIWSGQDNCGNPLNHTQTITVAPTPPAQFVMIPPPNVTSSCGELPLEIPSLVFENGQQGDCSIFGYAGGLQTGSFDACGGQIQYTWQHTDECGRSIIANQILNILPAVEPVEFQEPPGDINLPCGQTENQAIELYYTNGLQGSCAFNGIAAAITQTFPGYYINTWVINHPCTNKEIKHTQRVNISPLVNIVIDPSNVTVCAGETFNLSTIVVNDLNFNPNLVISYHTATPATNTNKLATPIFTPTITNNKIYVKATNAFGCFDEALLMFNVITQTGAGQGSIATECIDNSNINLFSYLSGTYDPNGTWSYTGSQTIDISKPNDVFVGNLTPGSYDFIYVVTGLQNCPNDTANVKINFVLPGTATISDISCAANLLTYTITLNVNNVTITSNVGTVNVISSNQVTISGIAITQNAQLTFTTVGVNCQSENLLITAPNCNCPDVAPPLNLGDKTICLNDAITLNVSVGAGLVANWYATQSSTTPLINNSTSYSPTTNTAGVFTYYVESLDPINNCKSLIRTPIVLQVLALPIGQNATLESCDDNGDGFTSFDLMEANILITSNSSYTITYHLTTVDANSGSNAISSPYLNTSINQNIYARVVDNNNCYSIITLSLKALQPPIFTTIVVPESCKDFNDGTITINSISAVEYKFGTLPWSTDKMISNLKAADYVVSVKDNKGCISTQTIAINPGRVLNITQYSIVCDNNGTVSISTDDKYIVKFIVTNSLGASNKFTAFFNSTNLGDFDYNIENTISLPANGQNGLLLLKDKVLACETSRVIPNLTPCSTTCEITANGVTITCNDNNTAADAADDFYAFSMSATVLNGSAAFNILVNDIIIGQYNYGQIITFNLPADGQVPTVVLRDLLDIACVKSLTVPALVSCSGSCAISSNVTNIRCNDNGTINDPSDDQYFFNIRVTGFNTSEQWKLANETATHAYNTVVTKGPYLISSGNLIVNVQDVSNPNCITPINVVAPPACSEPCVLQITEVTPQACENGGTGNTELDDVFDVKLNIKVVSGSANFYNVKVGNLSFGPFNYGQVITLNNLPANGNPLTLEISDGLNDGCKITTTVSSNPCSSCIQTVDAGANFTLTCTQNIATLAATTTFGNAIFTWTSTNNFIKVGQSITTSNPGIYYVEALFTDGCKAIDSTTVIKDPSLPTALAGADQKITCEIEQVTLTGSSNKTDNVKYTWTNASGAVLSNNISITVNSPGFYYFEVIDLTTNCASGKDEIQVINGRSIPKAEIKADPGNLLDCVVGIIKLIGVPEPNVIFNWQIGETVIINRDSIDIENGGVIKMTAVDTISGCTKTAQIQVIDLQDYPILNTKPTIPITCATNSTLLDASSSPDGINLVYRWYRDNDQVISGANKDTLRVLSPGIYVVELVDTVNSCANRDTFIVTTIGDFPIINTVDSLTILCNKDLATLSVEIVNPVSPTTIKWSTADGAIIGTNNSKEISIKGDGIYTVEVTYNNSGCRSADQIQVNIDDNIPRAAALTIFDELCQGDLTGEASIDSIFGGKNPYQILLNNKQVDELINLASGDYELTILDDNGCRLDTVFTISPGNTFNIQNIPSIEIIYDDTLEVAIVLSIPDSLIKSVEWLPAEYVLCDTCLITKIIGRENITYVVTVFDIFGCSAKVDIHVRLKDNTVIIAPNIINTSGTDNTKFTIYGNDGLLTILNLTVYDRWGNLMFSRQNFAPNDPQEGWDGNINGTPVDQGVYIYKAEVQTRFKRTIVAGDITVIR